MTRIAIIDMGTNTFHLLIANAGGGKYEIILRQHDAVKLGQAGINEGLITDAAWNRAMTAMRRFRQTIDDCGVATTYAFGTSAIRNASNGAALVEEIKRTTGITVRVISGDEEAGYIFEGVKAALDLGDEGNLVMDIGAGSVEFIIGDSHRIHWMRSFELGGQRLFEKFQKHDPVSEDEITELNTYLEKELHPLQRALTEFRPRTLVGSSGTFDTLSDIFYIQHNLSRTGEETETSLTLAGFYEIFEDLIHKDRAQRMQIPGMIEMRVDMITVSCCLIRYVLKAYPFERIRVSTYSLKEGVLASVAGQPRP